MKRAVVFAHYDKDAIIDNYVIYYVENLKKVADIIIFVSSNNLSEEEKSKLNVSHIISEQHNEYDFGSYKRGFFYLKDNNLLNDIDELIFANDSCYAPLFPFEEMFEKMENEQCDFWGVTKNKYGPRRDETTGECVSVVRPHVQSYFLAFKPQVFNSECFIDFLNNVKHEDDKADIIMKYEIGLSELLAKNEFSHKTYVNTEYELGDITLLGWRDLIKKYKSPFIKCCLLRGILYKFVDTVGWNRMVKRYTKFPIEKIYINLDRTHHLKTRIISESYLLKIYLKLKQLKNYLDKKYPNG